MAEIRESAQQRDDGARKRLRENSIEVLDDGDLIEVTDRDEEKLKQEDLAPDGGWGWMVALGMTIVLVITCSTVPCIPIIFDEILESTGQAGSALALLNSLMIVSWSISALFTNSLMKKYSMRVTGTVSAMMSSAVGIMSAIVTNYYQLVLIFIIQGVGMGVMLTICQCNFNAYFVKRRVKIFSAVQIVVGVGIALYTFFIGVIMEAYGFRGAAALIGAISLHNVFGMMLMHPVNWYAADSSKSIKKRGKLVGKSLKNKLEQKKTGHVELKRLRPVSDSNRQNDSEEFKETSEPLLTRTSKIQSAVSAQQAASSSVHTIEAVIEVRGHVTGSQVSSTPAKVLQEQEDRSSLKNVDIQSQEDSKLQRKIDLFDFVMLKDHAFIITSLGVSFAISSDVIFISLLPLAMFDRGYTSRDAAKAITVLAAAEFVSKILLTILTIIVDVRVKTIFFLAMTTMTMIKLSFFFLEHTLTGIMISMAAIGLVRVFMLVPQPLVIVENYPVEKYAACYGIFSLINGTLYVITNSIFGIIKDSTKNFSLCQILLIVLNSSFIIPWGIELARYYRRMRSPSDAQSSIVK